MAEGDGSFSDFYTSSLTSGSPSASGGMPGSGAQSGGGGGSGWVPNLLLDVASLHSARKRVLESEPGLDPAVVRRATLEPVAWGPEFDRTGWLTASYAGAQERLTEELQGLRADLERFAQALKQAAEDYERVDDDNAAALDRAGSGLEQLLSGPLQAGPVDNTDVVASLRGTGGAQQADQAGQADLDGGMAQGSDQEG